MKKLLLVATTLMSLGLMGCGNSNDHKNDGVQVGRPNTNYPTNGLNAFGGSCQLGQANCGGQITSPTLQQNVYSFMGSSSTVGNINTPNAAGLPSGVFILGRIITQVPITQLAQSGQAVQIASNSQINIQIIDDMVGQPDPNSATGQTIPPISITLSQGQGMFPSTQSPMVFADQYGKILVRASIQGSNVVGAVSYDNGYGEQPLGNFTAPVCGIFVCQ